MKSLVGLVCEPSADPLGGLSGARAGGLLELAFPPFELGASDVYEPSRLGLGHFLCIW